MKIFVDKSASISGTFKSTQPSRGSLASSSHYAINSVSEGMIIHASLLVRRLSLSRVQSHRCLASNHAIVGKEDK
jgi:hypothetical protein